MASISECYREDLDCSYHHPQRQQQQQEGWNVNNNNNNSNSNRGVIWGNSVRGMGKQQQYDTEGKEEDVYPWYNTVLSQHRQNRVSMWKRSMKPPTSMTMYHATDTIYQALFLLTDTLPSMAKSYDWDGMLDVLKWSLWKDGLEESFYTCLGALKKDDDHDDLGRRMVIGFDWGSCAWRHCGAQADYQEAFAELYSNIGMYEPYECLFVLDVMERCLRDVLDVIPMKYHSMKNKKLLKPYVPYQSVGGGGKDDDFFTGGTGESSIDEDFLKALARLRNDIPREI